MKITREHYRAGPGHLVVNGFVKANVLERIFLRRLMRAGRHNLRPSYNWPGLRRHGASFVLAAKGSPNKDMGRKPGYPLHIEQALKRKHSGFELWCVGLGMGVLQQLWWLGVLMCLMGVVLPRLLERQRQR